MATKTIPQLPAAGATTSADLFDVSQDGVESKMTAAQLLTFVQSNVGAPLSGSGSPVGVVTPSVVGQTYFDTAGPGFWVATGLTSANWLQLI